MFPTARAFIKRDFLLATSYKANFAAQLLAILAKLIIFYYLVAVFEGPADAILKNYGGNYFAYVLIGLAFWDYLAASLTAFNTSMRENQMMGTLEFMLLAPIKLPILVIASSLWSYLFVSFRFLLFLLLGVFLFGLDMGNANLLGGLVILILSIFAFASLGIALACLIIVFKQGDSRRFVILSSVVLGGVFFPVETMPGWLSDLSALIPMTHSINAMRAALLHGHSLSQMMPELLSLLLFTVILMPLGLVAFDLAVRRAKVNGDLSHY